MDKEKLEKEFSKIYEQKILPKTKFYEEKRLKYRQLAKILSILAVILGIVLIFIFKIEIIFADIVLTLINILIIWCFIDSKYASIVKKDFQDAILSCFGEFYTNKKECISLKEIKDLYPKATTKSNSDIIVGLYKDTQIIIEETECTNGSGRSSVTYFDGALVKIKMSKHHKATTILRSRICSEEKRSNLQKVNLEDPEFQRAYSIYSTDQIEARYILTPSFMERLKDLSVAFGSNYDIDSRYPDILLKDGYIIIALHSALDLFEVGSIFKTMLNVDVYKSLFNQIVSILEMVDELKIQENIGL